MDVANPKKKLKELWLDGKRPIIVDMAELEEKAKQLRVEAKDAMKEHGPEHEITKKLIKDTVDAQFAVKREVKREEAWKNFKKKREQSFAAKNAIDFAKPSKGWTANLKDKFSTITTKVKDLGKPNPKKAWRVEV